MNKEQILGIIRHSLTFLGGILIMKGITDGDAWNEISGGIVTLTGAIWSIIDKFQK